MRTITVILLTLFLNINSFSQSFKIDSDQKHMGSVGSEVKAVLTIRNLTNKPLQLQIKRINSQLGSSQNSYFCWGDDCIKDQSNAFSSSKTIEARGLSSKFTSVLEAGLVETNSAVKYLIYNVNNPADSIIHEVSYVIEDQNLKKILFHNKDIQISNIYPNPVANFAFFNYTLSAKKKEAKIVIHNVLGSIIAEYDLPHDDSRIKISTNELNSGVYFYTIKVDNDNLITKKLIIKR
jgi:hypothetical protein